MNNYNVIKLNAYSAMLGDEVVRVSDVLLNDERFPIWCGGLKEQHHNYKGGLVEHTKEVVELCWNTVDTLTVEVDKTELFLSALFHDAGKLYDFEIDKDETFSMDKPVFKESTHKRLIHHISRSGIMWSKACGLSDEINEKYHDLVLHAILSHHGQREWGSPVAPKSRVAWIVHLCDNLSARVNDCDRIDLVKVKK